MGRIGISTCGNGRQEAQSRTCVQGKLQVVWKLQVRLEHKMEEGRRKSAHSPSPPVP